MAITISGENNNDRILASDGVIDQISGINIVGLITASHINVGSNIQLGNAGIITATTFVGNVTGNVNSTSPLLLQTGGSERFRITGNNELGIAGGNYGTSGQVLTSGGSGSAVSWTTIPTQVTISNNSDNRVITGGSGTNLNGEANLTFDGTKLNLTTGGAGFRITRNSQYIELDGNFGNGGDQSLATSAGFRIQTGGIGNSYERLRITSGGSILIDTTVTTEASGDGSDLIIGSTSDTHKGISIVGSTSGGIGNIFFTDGAGYKNQGLIQYRHADDSMRFTTAQNERLRITSTGAIQFSGTNTADNTNKLVYLTTPSYDTDEEPFGFIHSGTYNNQNLLYLGGGMTSSYNACTLMKFWTSPINTQVGLERLCIESWGGIQNNQGAIYGGGVANEPKVHFNGAAPSNDAARGHFAVSDSAAYNASPIARISLVTRYNSAGGYTYMGGIEGGKETTGDGNYGGFVRIMTRLHGNTNQERVRITSTGEVNVGGDYTQTSRFVNLNGGGRIGQLQLKGTEADLWLHSTGPNGQWRILGSTGTNTHKFRVYDQTNSAERFSISSDGTSTFDVGAPSSSNKVIGRFQAQSSRQLDIVWHDSGSLMGFDTPGNHSYIFKVGGTERARITGTDATISGTTDGVLNLTTTDSRGSFIRFQQGGASKCWVGSGQGLSLGGVNDLGLRATTHIRMRSGSEEHGLLTSEGHFAAKGDAGSWVSNTSPTNTLVHQFCNTGNGRWAMQIQQEHHNGMCLQLRIAGSGNQEAFQVYKYNSTASTRFRVLQNGNCANVNNSFGSLSDVSLKENIVDANSQWNDIKSVKVRNFNFKDDTDKVNMIGVVAQEIETVSPKLVWEDTEGLKNVSYSILYMKAIKCLQEAQARIETLEAKVATLEGS